MWSRFPQAWPKTRFQLRLVVACLSAFCFLLYRFMQDGVVPWCVRDGWHELTADLNLGLRDGVDDAVIGIGQVLMDGWILVCIVVWAAKCRNARVVYALALFFAVRTVILSAELFPFPQHVVWHSPGFFSFSVPYDPTRDFFFSGHTGTLSIIMIELFTLDYEWVTGCALVSLIYMMNMLTITRVHYSIDIAGGLIFGFFAHKMAKRIVFYGDWLFSMPYLLVRRVEARRRSRRGMKVGIMDLEERLAGQN